jgi:uncharacterized protein (DUF2252 family)
MAARSSDLPGMTTALMLEEMIGGYIAGLRGQASRVDPDDIAPIGKVMRQAKGRRWRHLAKERIEDVKPTIPLGPKFWPLSKTEIKELKDLIASEDLHGLLHRLNGKKAKHVELLDAAYWMKGCSSLGRLRYAVLVGVGGGKDSDYRLLDVKEAVRAAAPRSSKAPIPKNNAERVVTGALALSPFLGERMLAACLSDRQVVIRELRPQDLKFDLVGLKQDQAVSIARLMAGVVGRAHGRQLGAGDRRAWASELRQRHASGLNAPRWLWSSILDLAALHEAAYLDHCRHYALGVSP